MRRTLPSLALFSAGVTLVVAAGVPTAAARPDKKDKGETLPPPSTSDVEHVEKLLTARKDYEAGLKRLWQHYASTGDKLRQKWAEEELMAYHLMFKPSYNLDVQDVPPPTLVATTNVKEANELYRMAMEYKGKGTGQEYVLNMRRAELLLREILEKYPNSDKIPEVAYQLGEMYESRAYRQFDRAARYYERSFQWARGSRTDARLKAAVLYDRQLNERSKAITLYRDVVEHDIDADRIRTAERRLAELTGGKK
jgi:tetratricopeptide (TPR) repeat protein